MAGPGGRLVVPAPTRAGPPIGLLSAAEIVPINPADRVPDRWLNGITYEPEKCGSGGALYAGCAVDTVVPTQSKTIDANAAIVERDAFTVWAGDKCSTFGWEARDYVGRARRLLEACESKLVEAEFWTGTAAKAGATAGVDYSTNQWLANDDATTVNATATAPALAWGALLDALDSCGCGSQAFIHVPSRLLPSLQAAGIVRRDGRRYLDGMDNVVVAGVGYPGTSPAGGGSSANAAWVFATSPVRVYRSDVQLVPGSYAQALNRTTNTIEFRAERDYLVDFDGCCKLAIQVSYCNTCS